MLATDLYKVSGQGHWESLPPDVFRSIVARLPDVRTKLKLGSTCKLLRERVVEAVEGVKSRFTDEGLAKCCRTFPHLQDLTIKSFSPITDISPLHSLTQLSSLTCAFTRTCISSRSVRCIPGSIRELDIRGTKIHGRGLLALNLPNLKLLDIRSTYSLASQDLATLLLGCRNLEVLGISAEGQDASKLWMGLRHFPKLRDVRLDQASFFLTLDPTACPTAIKTLELAYSRFSTATILRDIIETLPQLVSLHLEMVYIHNMGHWPSQHSRLQSLLLFRPFLRPEELDLPSLTRLWISPFERVTSLPPLPRFLSGLRNLTSLLLADVFGMESVSAPGDALLGLPLRELAIIRCCEPLTLSLLKPLEGCKSLKHLTLIDMYGISLQKQDVKGAAASILRAPALTLLTGESEILKQTAKSLPSVWSKGHYSTLLDPELKDFAKHGGFWSCYSKGQ